MKIYNKNIIEIEEREWKKLSKKMRMAIENNFFSLNEYLFDILSGMELTKEDYEFLEKVKYYMLQNSFDLKINGGDKND